RRWRVTPGVVGDAPPGLQGGLLPRHDIGILVDVEADAMAGAVDEVFAIAGVCNDLPSCSVDGIARYPWPDRVAGAELSGEEDLVVGEEVIGRLADGVGTRLIRAVAGLRRASDVD